MRIVVHIYIYIKLHVYDRSCTVTSRLEVVLTLDQWLVLVASPSPVTHQVAVLSTEFRHGQLGIEAVHATNGTQVAAPNATFEEPGPNHRTKSDQQQQARGQVGRILQAPNNMVILGSSKHRSKLGGCKYIMNRVYIYIYIMFT